MPYIRVRVQTGRRKESVTHEHDLWRIAVREKAERGAANVRVRELLAHALQVPPKALRLVAGATSPAKTYLLTNKQKHEDKL